MYPATVICSNEPVKLPSLPNMLVRPDTFASARRCSSHEDKSIFGSFKWQVPKETYVLAVSSWDFLNYLKPESLYIIWEYHCIFFFGTCLKWCRPFAHHAKLCILTKSSRSVNNQQKSEQKQHISSRKLTYPTAGKRNSSSTIPRVWIC